MGLRPEHLRVAPAGQGIAASVVLAEHLGDSSILHLKVDGVTELLHAKVGIEHSAIDTGQAVALVPDATWSLAFDSAGRLLA